MILDNARGRTNSILERYSCSSLSIQPTICIYITYLWITSTYFLHWFWWNSACWFRGLFFYFSLVKKLWTQKEILSLVKFRFLLIFLLMMFQWILTTLVVINMLQLLLVVLNINLDYLCLDLNPGVSDFMEYFLFYSLFAFVLRRFVIVSFMSIFVSRS